MMSTPPATGKVHRPHPIVILENLWRVLYLLLLPLLRGFLVALQGGVGEWLQGAWFDILVVLVMVGVAVVQWHCVHIRFSAEAIQVTSGIFWRKRRQVPLEKVCTYSVVRLFFFKPIRAVHVIVDTLAGPNNRADIDLTVTRRLAQTMLKKQKLRGYDNAGVRVYRPATIHVAMLSVMMSNSLAGIVFLATFISQSGNLLGEAFSSRIVGTFQRFSQVMAFGVPPAAAAFAYLLLFGWLYTVLLNMIRYQRFIVGRAPDALMISGGIISSREYWVSMDSINFVDIRQTLMSRLFGIYTVSVNAVGFGKKKDDLAAVLPAVNRRGLLRTMRTILPEYKVTERKLKPNSGAIFKFILEPIWACVLIPAAAVVVYLLFKPWQQVIVFVGFMLTLPAIWFFIVRLIDFFTSGISVQGDYYTLRYSKGMFLHTVIIPKRKIAYVDLRQSILQKMDKKCDVKLRTISDHAQIHHIRNLDRQAVIDTCGFALGGMDNEDKTPAEPLWFRRKAKET